MEIKSKAPFRIGLAGGGSDVSPYTDDFGGAVVSASISLFAHTTIIPRTDGKIIIKAIDRNEELVFDSKMELPLSGVLDLQIGVYNRIVKDYTKESLSFEMTTSMDVSSGSGLGTSSTLVTSILGAFIEWLQLPIQNYELAQLAYDIERIDLKMAGGKQDQYAAVFGGLNFIEFSKKNKVTVTPIVLKDGNIEELEKNLILYYTKTSRESAKIIEIQAANARKKIEVPIQAMHIVKEQAFEMKDILLANQLNKIGEILSISWENKKKMATGITNELIDDIYSTAINTGATGGKISGAGGGGFMIFYAEEANRYKVIEALGKFGGQAKRYQFSKQGLTTWTVS